jgi:hypothetical protein
MRTRARLRAAFTLVLPAAVALARPVWAGPAAEREAARALAGKGYELFEAGQYQRAIELFQQAEGRFHAPPHLLYIARAEVKLGKLLDARATLQRIVDEKLAADAPAPFKEAQTSARSDLTEVEVLIPTIVIAFDGAAPPGTRVLVDGAPVEAASLGQPLRQDPGAHVVTALPPGMPPVTRSVLLSVGGAETRVALAFPKPPSRSVVPAVIAFSAGAVGVGVGVTAAAVSIHAAPSSQTALHVAEGVGFGVGGAGIVTGIVLLALRPRAPSPVVAGAVRVCFGPGSIEVDGAF